MFDADYFESGRSQRHVVAVRLEDSRIYVKGESIEYWFAREDASLQPRIGNTPARVVLANGGLLIARSEYAIVEHTLGASAAKSLVHRLEMRADLVVFALLFVVLAGAATYIWGIPRLARVVAQHIPPATEQLLGEEALRALDRTLTAPSQLAAAQQDDYRREFDALVHTAKLASQVRLEFREGGAFVQANAFALPGGIVLVTDQLLNAVASKDKFAAVIAHELGHIERRHVMRHILETSMVGILTLALWGDASGVGAIAASVPTVLAQSGYSRDAEREADDYSISLLRRTGRTPALLADALEDLFAYHDTHRRNQRVTQETVPKRHDRNIDYFSSHPGLEERAKAARDAAKAR